MAQHVARQQTGAAAPAKAGSLHRGTTREHPIEAVQGDPVASPSDEYLLDPGMVAAVDAMELATQIVKGLTPGEVYSSEAWQLHMRQRDVMEAIAAYEAARESLQRSVHLLSRRCVRMLANEIESGRIEGSASEDSEERLAKLA